MYYILVSYSAGYRFIHTGGGLLPHLDRRLLDANSLHACIGNLLGVRLHGGDCRDFCGGRILVQYAAHREAACSGATVDQDIQFHLY